MQTGYTVEGAKPKGNQSYEDAPSREPMAPRGSGRTSPSTDQKAVRRQLAKSAGALEEIRDRDPNGGSTQPTAEDYRRHEEWARATFGNDAWAEYQGWGKSEDTPYDPSADDPEHIEPAFGSAADPLEPFADSAFDEVSSGAWQKGHSSFVIWDPEQLAFTDGSGIGDWTTPEQAQQFINSSEPGTFSPSARVIPSDEASIRNAMGFKPLDVNAIRVSAASAADGESWAARILEYLSKGAPYLDPTAPPLLAAPSPSKESTMKTIADNSDNSSLATPNTNTGASGVGADETSPQGQGGNVGPPAVEPFAATPDLSAAVTDWHNSPTHGLSQEQWDNENSKESILLAAAVHASLPEQQALMAEVDSIRARRAARTASARELDLGDDLVATAMQPLSPFTAHSTYTDFLGEDGFQSEASAHDIGQAMTAQATLWFQALDADVMADSNEFAVQAQGMARHLAGQYLPLDVEAADAFVRHASFLRSRTADFHHPGDGLGDPHDSEHEKGPGNDMAGLQEYPNPHHPTRASKTAGPDWSDAGDATIENWLAGNPALNNAANGITDPAQIRSLVEQSGDVHGVDLEQVDWDAVTRNHLSSLQRRADFGSDGSTWDENNQITRVNPETGETLTWTKPQWSNMLEGDNKGQELPGVDGGPWINKHHPKPGSGSGIGVDGSKLAADADINPYPAHDQAGYAETGLPDEPTGPDVPFDNFASPVLPENAAAVEEEGDHTPMPGAGESVGRDTYHPLAHRVQADGPDSLAPWTNTSEIEDQAVDNWGEVATGQEMPVTTSLNVQAVGDIVDKVMKWENGDMDQDEEVAFFQELVDSGMAWQLQGAYGRNAQALIDAGLVHTSAKTGGNSDSDGWNKAYKNQHDRHEETWDEAYADDKKKHHKGSLSLTAAMDTPEFALAIEAAFTHKAYAGISSVLGKYSEQPGHEAVTAGLADLFMADNPSFNREAFMVSAKAPWLPSSGDKVMVHKPGTDANHRPGQVKGPSKGEGPGYFDVDFGSHTESVPRDHMKGHAASRTAADQNGQGNSALPMVNEANPATMWEWELPATGDPQTGQGAADVAGTSTPGSSVADYPQPKNSKLDAFRQKVAGDPLAMHHSWDRPETEAERRARANDPHDRGAGGNTAALESDAGKLDGRNSWDRDDDEAMKRARDRDRRDQSAGNSTAALEAGKLDMTHSWDHPETEAERRGRERRDQSAGNSTAALEAGKLDMTHSWDRPETEAERRARQNDPHDRGAGGNTAARRPQEG